MSLQGRLSFRLVRVRIELVPFEQLGRAQNRVRRDVQIEVFFDFRCRDVTVETRDLADQIDLLGREFFVAARTRLVVYRLRFDVLLEERRDRLARDFYIILGEKSLSDLFDSKALLKAQVEDAILGKRGQTTHSCRIDLLL